MASRRVISVYPSWIDECASTSSRVDESTHRVPKIEPIFKGLTFDIAECDFNAKAFEECQNLVKSRGGVISNSGEPHRRCCCDYLICIYSDTEIVRQTASMSGCKIRTWFWFEECIQAGSILETSDIPGVANPQPNLKPLWSPGIRNGITDMRHLKICLSGFSPETTPTKFEVSQLVHYVAGKDALSNNLYRTPTEKALNHLPATTHLLIGPAYKSNPRKYEAAKQWRDAGHPIAICSYEWLVECHRSGKRVEEDSFSLQVAEASPKTEKDGQTKRHGQKRPRSEQAANTSPKIFVLGGFNESEKMKLQHDIIALGGKVCEPNSGSESDWKSISHVILYSIKRTEKLLCGVSKGAWILTQEYITASESVGKWVSETDFEWYSDEILKKKDEEVVWMGAMRRWREQDCLPFSGWRVGIIDGGSMMKPPAQLLSLWVGLGGGCTVRLNSVEDLKALKALPNDQASPMLYVTALDHVWHDANVDFKHALESWSKDDNVMQKAPTFLRDYLLLPQR